MSIASINDDSYTHIYATPNTGKITLFEQERVTYGNIYIKFTQYIHIRGTQYANYTDKDISFETTRTELNDKSRFTTSPSNISDCLLLKDLEALVIDHISRKVKIVTRNQYNCITHTLLLLNVAGKATTGLLLDIYNQQYIDNLQQNAPLTGGLQQYAINNIQEAQKKVVDISTNDTIQFAFATDLHADDYLNYYDQIQRHLKAIVDIQKYGILDFIAIGGDLHSGVYPDKENPKAKLSELSKTLKDSKIPVLVLHGNHDDNSYNVVAPLNPVLSSIITKKEWFNRMIRPFMNGEIHDTCDSMSLYYYKDFYDKKLRVICLDSTDYPIIVNSDNTLKWHGQNFWGYGARQVQWLQSEALNTLEKNDWSVIILSHMATRDTDLMFNGYEPYNGNLIEGLLKAFMNGCTFTGTTTGDSGVTVNGNFTSQGSRKILCYVYGHTHTDNNNKPVDLGWNFINTASCYSSGIALRAIDTNTEDLWDVIVADKSTSVVDCFRYGYGVDRHMV